MNNMRLITEIEEHYLKKKEEIGLRITQLADIQSQGDRGIKGQKPTFWNNGVILTGK